MLKLIYREVDASVTKYRGAAEINKLTIVDQKMVLLLLFEIIDKPKTAPDIPQMYKEILSNNALIADAY